MLHAARSIRFALAFLAWCLASPTWAGGGPENVLLVVNGRSATSLAIANHWAALRDLNEANIVVLDWDGSVETTNVDAFRRQILQPVIDAMAQRGLGGQIDYIVYSADMPHSIDISGDGKPKGIPKGSDAAFASTASINGLTYLWQMVLGAPPNYIAPKVNYYFRHPAGRSLPTQAFSSWRGWTPQGNASTLGGSHYQLSTMLAVTAGRGTTLAESVAYLTAAAKADGTHPNGTIYYVQSEDKARSAPRHDKYPAAVSALQALGVRATILQGRTPDGHSDVQGAMLGIDRFVWPKTNSKILPGAICDHLTSFAGVMRKGGGQTSLAEFLKYGAAGACGTVVEPLNVPDKFPHPDIHVHYARGCSLAEAFYQSIGWPYQVLIVGDPLCRPWANIPVVKVVDGDGKPLADAARLKGIVTLRPSAKTPRDGAVKRFELFVDGVRMDKCADGETLSFDTNRAPDGFHELRVVAIEASDIESQGRAILPVVVNNRGKVLMFTATVAKRVKIGAMVDMKVDAPGASTIIITHQHREVARVERSNGKVQVRTSDLGQGPVRLYATAYTGQGKDLKPLAVSKPVEFYVTDERGK